ncbi:MAG: hypothetical protein JWN82_651 [Candidatus Saccharibacteria bacterium]|nr:hypothetical protein [Candidatus Saccharibacteria bacterium]
MSKENVTTHLEQQPILPPEEIGALALHGASDDTNPIEIKEVQTKESDLGLLSAAQYRERRSDTLLNNPEAALDEETEIAKYFARQEQSYVDEIKGLANLSRPMKQSVRAVVTLIGYSEGSRIKHTLEEYAKQDIDPSLFEIVMLDNHPEGIPDDGTASEVVAFQQEHPEISITFAQKVWADGEPATVGNARRHAFDIALARVSARDALDGSTVLISNDADAVAVAPNYLSSIINEFEAKPDKDGLVTRMNLPDEVLAKPNVAAGFLVLGGLEESLEEGSVEAGLGKEPATFVGRSSAVRASVYAAVGGFNQDAVIAEDAELSWMIADARNWDAERVVRFDDTTIVTDPRRHLDAIMNKVPFNQMLFNFQSRPDLRQMSNDEILDQIPAALDWELLEGEVNDGWQAQFSGYKRFGDRFEPLFKTAMTKLGIEYEVVDGNVALKNVNGLLDLLSKDGKPIEVVHSEPRAYTPELIEQLKSFFGALPRGVIEARNSSTGR